MSSIFLSIDKSVIYLQKFIHCFFLMMTNFDSFTFFKFKWRASFRIIIKQKIKSRTNFRILNYILFCKYYLALIPLN